MRERFNLHQLTTADVSLLRELNDLFAEAFEDTQTFTAEPPGDGYVKALLAREHVVVLAALEGDTVVGGLVAYELEKFERARSEMYIYDLAVAQPNRRRGIATALIERLREIAAQRGAYLLYVQADIGDAPAIALYEKFSARKEVLHFDIAVTLRKRP